MENENQNKPIVIVGGKKVEVEAGTSFKEVIATLAQQKGYTNIRVRTIEPGTQLPVEISMSKAPETMRYGDVVEITPFDRAA